MLPAAAGAQVDFCGITNTAFTAGEKLQFRVYYNMGRIWVAAGEASFNVAQEKLGTKEVYHIIGDGKTLKSYEWFYKVKDRYETFIDMATMLPVKFIRNVDEGGFRIYNNVSFNQRIGQAVSTKGVFKIPACIQDVLSAIYYARSIDYNKYKPGARIPFAMYLDDEVHNLYIRYVGKEKIETKYGTFNAIKISPLLVKGTIFSGGEQMMIWVSDDANHIPLRISSPIAVGSIKVDMLGYSGLRSPLKSLVSKK